MGKDTANKSAIAQAAEFIVKRRQVFFLLFAALIVFSVFSMGWVQVEEDITVFLPDSAEAKQGLTIMEREFITRATAQVMVEDISLEEAEQLQERLAAIPGMASVDFDGTEESYKENSALYRLNFTGQTEDEDTVAAMEQVRETLNGYKSYINTLVGNDLSDVIANEMVVVLILVAIVVVGVLIFTSQTYGEVLVLLATFLAAAIINKGTNFLMGEISFVSDSVAIVLQLALSVDYAIIFCNRYKEEHELLPIKEAVERALAQSIPEISASSLTTMAGLTAMTFMEFRLGADMGICLIKAIACSLLSVFLFMPSLLVLLGPLMDRTKHKSFVPKIAFVGKFAYASRHVLPVLFVGVVIGAYIIFGNCSYSYTIDTSQPNGRAVAYRQSENDLAIAQISGRFGHENTIAVLVPAGDYEKEIALLAELEARGEVKSALGLASVEAMDGYLLGEQVDYREFAELSGTDETLAQALFAYHAAEQGMHRTLTEEGLDQYKAPLLELLVFLHENAQNEQLPLDGEQKELIDELYAQLEAGMEQLQGAEYSRILLITQLPEQHEDTFAFLDRVHLIAGQYYPEGVVLTGNSVSAQDFSRTFEKDNTIVGLMSLVLVMLILLFTFKSIGMPLLLIMVIQGSIWINFSIPTLRGEYVFFMCYLIVSAIQMGANIDYAIVISSRYTALRPAMSRREAIIESMNLAFPTIITSGTMMVIAGLLIGYRVSQHIIAGMGRFVGIGTIISLGLVLFVLPQILVFGDGFVRATSFKLKSGRGLLHRPGALRQTAAVVLASAALLAAVALPISVAEAKAFMDETEQENGQLLERSRELSALAQKLSMEQERYDSTMLSFAERYVTEIVGGDELEKGEAEYEQGADRLAEGQEEYDAGAAQIAEARQLYQAGLDRLQAGQAEYDAGQAQLDAAKADYAAGEQRLAEGQRQYDEGIIQLDAAKAEYAAGEAQLRRIEPIYNLIMPLYSRYQERQAEYDAAVSEGDLLRAAVLRPLLETERLAFETELALTGYSLAGILTEYEAGQTRLSEGAVLISQAEQTLAEAQTELEAGYAELEDARLQINAAEAQMQAARAELDAGYRELDAAAAQIEAGQRQLDEAKAELDEGYGSLFTAQKQLEEGRETIAENRRKLQEDLAALDQYTAEDQRLANGIELLMSQPEVANRAGRLATYSQICSAAQIYFGGQIDSAEGEYLWACRSAVLLGGALLLALAAALLKLRGKRGGLAAALSGLGAVLAIASALLWKGACDYTGALALAASVLLAVVAVLCTDIFAAQARSAAEEGHTV